MDDDPQAGSFWEHPEDKVRESEGRAVICTRMRLVFGMLGWNATGVVGLGTEPCPSWVVNNPRFHL